MPEYSIAVDIGGTFTDVVLRHRDSRFWVDKTLSTPENLDQCFFAVIDAVLRRAGTERPFTGKYEAVWADGSYHCICCGNKLFDAGTKFDAGCGWPSFYAPANEEIIDTQVDRSHCMVRDEIMCSQCGAHLGHVFPDSPRPTGQRYCVNSASLKFEPKKER